MDRRKEVETVDGNEMDTGWRYNVHIGEQKTEIVRNFWTRLSNFAKCGTGTWATLIRLRHSIELTVEDVRAIDTASYCTRTDTHELEKAEINKILRMKAIEPPQSE